MMMSDGSKLSTTTSTEEAIEFNSQGFNTPSILSLVNYINIPNISSPLSRWPFSIDGGMEPLIDKKNR